jgi:phage FluMu protein Com
MDRAEFSKLAYAKGPRYTASFGALPVKCPKCTEDSVFAAIKCEKCGKVFFASTVEGPYDDKCPACEYSKKEEAAKQQTKPVKK